MPKFQLKWILLLSLSLVWGSSFILMKKGLVGLTPLQLGALRTAFASIFLMSFGFKGVFKIKKEQWKWMVTSGFLGTFFPAFLFAFSETEIDSAIVSILNSTVPILALIVGFLLFRVHATKNQIAGVFIGLLGSIFLIFSGATVNGDQNYFYALLPLVATTMYAINVHVIKQHLQNIPVLALTTGCFSVLLIPSLVVLFFTGFFSTEVLTDETVQVSILYIGILAVLGTGIAKILFNRLVQVSNPTFTTSVTYVIPIVALFWGVLDGEKFTLIQVLAGAVILIGVYLTHKKRKNKGEAVFQTSK